MGLQYNKNKSEDSGSFWTSYSDLFLGMSVVFLLLYVTASLRQGTSGIQQQIQNQKLTMQVQDLKNQLKMYDSVKKDYLKNEAKPDEEKVYNELMDKLSLLREEAKDEKSRLIQAAQENDKKEKALNQYQQMIRNIVNANLMAKTKMKTREDVIEEQDEEIVSQESEIAQLEKDVSAKKKKIAENQQKIADANEQLQERLAELKKAYRQKKMSEAAYERKVQDLKEQSEAKLENLNANNRLFKNQLAQVQGKLGEVSSELEKTQKNLGTTTQALQASQEKTGKLEEQLNQAQTEHNQQVQALQNQFSDQAAKDRAKFEKELAKERITGAEKARREAEYRNQAAKKEKELGQKLANLGQELQEKEGRLREKEGALAAKQKALESAGRELQDKDRKIKDTEGLLAKARAEADARKQISKNIKEGFKKAGVDADINENTGEVVINFGDVYFDNDSAKLKEKMKETLKKAMPIYSKSLLGNKKVSDKISSIEIVGFASPTFQGKYVDPTSLNEGAKAAILYNLDLSAKRAREIFKYVFDENNMQFDHQKDMLPLIKVTGRSFLAEKLPDRRAPGSKNSGDFCNTHDCRKAQRVIIKFSFDDKK